MAREVIQATKALLLALVWLLAPAAAPPPAPPIVPKVVIQFSHPQGVDAAAWANDGALLITASGFDASVLLWDTDSGEIIDHLNFPRLDALGEFTIDQLRAITVAPDGKTVRFTVIASGSPNENVANEYRRYTLDLDLDNRRFAVVGKPAVMTDAAVAALKPPPLPASPDGRTLTRLDLASASSPGSARHGVQIAAGNGKPAQQLLGQAPAIFIDADLSPDGKRIARLVRYGGVSTLVEVWDLATNAPLPTLIKRGLYDRVRWISSSHYVVSDVKPTEADKAGKDPLPALVVDAASNGGPRGQVEAIIPSRCLTTPIGDTGMFVGSGPGSCGKPVSAADGLYVFAKGQWQRRKIEEIDERLITGFAITPDHTLIAVALTPRAPIEKTWPPTIAIVGVDPARPIGGQSFEDHAKDLYDSSMTLEEARDESRIQSLAFSSDGSALLSQFVGGVLSLGITESHTLLLPSLTDRADLIASDGKTAVVGGVGFKTLQRYAMTDGKAIVPQIPISGAINGGYLASRPLFWAASDDGTLRFWDSRTGALRLTFSSFPNNRFFAALPDGRYDTNLAPDTDAVRWLVRDDPFVPLPSSTFMRQLYEPLLVGKLLGCVQTSCASVFRPLPDMATINRVLPVTQILSVERDPRDQGRALVNVKVAQGEDAEAPNGQTKSGIYDLRLFMGGRLVEQAPAPEGVTQPATGDLAGWRTATQVTDQASAVITLPIRLPGGATQVTLSTYAFNSDRVKGLTTMASFPLSPPAPPHQRRALVVAIGVDQTSNPDWRLNYAASDAEAMAAGLRAALLPGAPGQRSSACRSEPCFRSPESDAYRRVDAITLTSTAQRNLATKAIVHDVLQALAGDAPPAAVVATAKRVGVDPALLAAITPDDLLIISYSGHGDTIDGQFYIVPADAGIDAAGKPALPSLISAAELTLWLRKIDPADMALIIDACHSAASVDADGFRPGPMGDPGLGQLAYDKGIRILAATQADNVAMEDGRLGHGLLTYALVTEGLAPGTPADLNGDGELNLEEWLRFAVGRLPGLADDIAAGRMNLMGNPAPARARNFTDLEPLPPQKRPVQRPALFNFVADHGPVLRPREGATG